jgi:integrase
VGDRWAPVLDDFVELSAGRGGCRSASQITFEYAGVNTFRVGGRQHLSICFDEQLRAQGVRNMLSIRQQKTGKPLVVPVHPHLQAVIDATPSEHLTFLVTATGKPYGGNAFSEQFRNWCDAAGLPKRCKPHGLRKAACRRLAEAGCSANEIMSISGHATMKEVVRYTAAADQARLARNAMTRTV